MLNEIQKQVTDRGLDQFVATWFEKRLPTAKEPTLSQAEHILDWIEAKKPTKLAKMRWDEVLAASEKWTKTEQKKGANIGEESKDTKLFMKVGQFNIVQLVGQNAFKREGHLMRHCVASYYGKSGMKIYSLRDSKNEPHATFEVVGDKNVQQVKGKGNGPIHPDYIDAVVQFLEKLGMEIRDSEMQNLGYINAEKYKKYLHKDSVKALFRGKYWNKKDKLLDKEGQEFASLEMLDDIPLISETSTALKVNFELKSFIKLSLDFLWKKCWNPKKTAASGDYAKLAASGDYAKLAASGDSAKLAASGDSAQLAASGHSAKLAASGHYAKLAASGHSAKLAASGHYAKLAASGDYAKLAASGDSAQLAASGHYAKLAASGHYAKLAASGDSAKLAASGHYAKLAASGDSAQLELTGNSAVGAAIGYSNKIKGKKGCWITLAEYETSSPWKVLCVKSVQIDGKTIKQDTWYKLEKGEFTEIK